jgi:FkbM family methyltransferase
MKKVALLLSSALIASALTLTAGQKSASSSAEAGPAAYPATMLREDSAAGLELWQTLIGNLWIPRPGVYVIKHLQWEQAIQKVYYQAEIHVRPGDVVIDCGAHIGGFTRTALALGASLVVAIEPEPKNLLAFRRNMETELKSGKVRLVPKGIFDKPGKLKLHLSESGDAHSVVEPRRGSGDIEIEVVTLDSLMGSLDLHRVDFIKMDIEGAEQKALQGARLMLTRYKPRLALSAYHEKGDPAAIASIVWEYHPEYLVESKDLVMGVEGKLVPKVLFFR